jgi:MFS family permease
VGTVAALLLPDPPARAEVAVAREPRTIRERLAALRDRDFAWLLAGRLTVNIGNALGTGLLLFFLLYGLHRDAATAEDELLLLILVYTLFVVVSSVVSGRISDRTGRRLPFVVWPAVIQGLASIILVVAPSLTSAMIAAALLGVGYGAYMSVSLALGTDLLPRAEDHARDLGFVNVSASLGQLIGPLLGAGLVALVGGFWLLFLVGGILSIIGGFMTYAIRARDRATSAV